MACPLDPDARKYYRVAKQRRVEAVLVLDKVELPRAAIYLAGYAIECILKALLLNITPPRDRDAMVKSLKRDFGHSLPLLREGLRRRGVNIPADVAKDITFAGSWSPELRYEPGPGDPREAARFLAATDKVVAWADGSI